MTRKSATSIETAIALLLLLAVLLVIIAFGPDLINLIKTGTSLASDNLEDYETKSGRIKGEFQDPLIVREAPISANRCTVGFVMIRNTGQSEWLAEDKVRAAFFCKPVNSVEPQLVQVYPESGYITNMKPSEIRDVYLNIEQQSKCLNSGKFQLILYSNCNGGVAGNQPCNNFGQDLKIINSLEFDCKSKIT